MRILVAEDDPTSRRVLEKTIERWGFKPIVVEDGKKAWEVLQREDCPQVAILDWMMPEMDGIEICRQVRNLDRPNPPHLILLTARTSKEDVMEGFDAGADDYMKKPCNSQELQARIRVAQRSIELRTKLTESIHELKEAFEKVRTLEGILPICMHCHKIRTDDQAWHKLESYIEKHSDAQFSHGLCPDCLEKHYPEPQEDSPE